MTNCSLFVAEHSFDAVLKLLDDLSEDASVDHRECGVLLTCVSELLFLRSGATEVERDAAKSDVPEVFTSAMVTIKVAWIVLPRCRGSFGTSN